MRAMVLVVAVAVLSACGGEDPVELCEDLIDRVVERAVECGVDAEQTRAGLEADLPCEDALNIRDEAQLVEECFPGIDDMDCDDPQLPSSCSEQVEF